jgi:hypothetical protein
LRASAGEAMMLGCSECLIELFEYEAFTLEHF